MAKSAKRKVVYILCLLFSFALITKSSITAGGIELDKNIDLTISCENDDTILSGAEFSIYKIGNYDFNGGVNLTKKFEGYPVDITKSNFKQWNEYANTLKSYILRDNITPEYKGKTDINGELKFSVEKGLYLVVGEDFSKKGFKYKTNPYIVLLPEYEEKSGKYIYKTISKPKFTKEKIPSENTSISVLKVWKDRGYEEKRPEDIEIELIGDGKIKDTVKLSEKNSWGHTWNKLDTDVKWSIAEKGVNKSRYSVALEEYNGSFVITNIYKENNIPVDNRQRKIHKKDLPKENKIPQTGQLWWPVYILSGTGIVSILLGLLKEKKKGDRNEE